MATGPSRHTEGQSGSRRERVGLWRLAAAGALWAATFAGPPVMAQGLDQAPVARLVRSVPVTDKLIALSFDDGPSPRYTPAVLDILQREGVHATFFVIGQEAERQPALLRREHDLGMEIGNHGMHHRRLAGLAPPEVEAEVREAARVIRAVTGTAPTLYRLPQGIGDETSLRVLGRLGYTVIAWSVDPRDYQRRTAQALAADILRQSAPGRIIILHDGGGRRAASVDALAQVLPRLRAEGYRVTTVGDLLRSAGFPLPRPSRPPGRSGR
jgi:peptidoglycan/xylan/chitin deacetylase (PgdA/CDA1 family)